MERQVLKKKEREKLKVKNERETLKERRKEENNVELKKRRKMKISEKES